MAWNDRAVGLFHAEDTDGERWLLQGRSMASALALLAADGSESQVGYDVVVCRRVARAQLRRYDPELSGWYSAPLDAPEGIVAASCLY